MSGFVTFLTFPVLSDLLLGTTARFKYISGVALFVPHSISIEIEFTAKRNIETYPISRQIYPAIFCIKYKLVSAGNILIDIVILMLRFIDF